jgi:predicted RNA-binding protein with PIN domain
MLTRHSAFVKASHVLTVLVDARNVLRSVWPNIPEERVVELCRARAEQDGVAMVVAFDGSAPGGLVGEQRLDGRCTVVGTGGESADDWLTRAAAALRDDARPFVLVTSDRELRGRAGEGAEEVVGGGRFARELTGAA